MKVAIAGAGITGAYLYRRLEAMHDVDIYDLKQNTRCGLAPCAWATTESFKNYAEKCGLEPDRYIQNRTRTVFLGKAAVTVALCTFDKPRFIKDLLKGAQVDYSPLKPHEYDRVIDATGVWRTFLPPIKQDIRIPCIQYLVQVKKPLENRISFGEAGYAWCFSLSHGRYHIGCASLVGSPRSRLESLAWLIPDDSMKIICDCEGAVRLASVQHSQPFVARTPEEEIWGVGEAIGCVSPLVGEGIIPGLVSAEILLNHWDDARKYSEALLAAFDWMKDERVVIDRLVGGKRIGIRDAWIIRKNSRRMGITVGLTLILGLMRSLR